MTSTGAPPPPRPRTCPSCKGSVKEEARYCPRCGVRLELTTGRMERFRDLRERWRALKGTVIFYTVYLATCMPLHWIPEDRRAAGIMIVSTVDIFVVLGYWRLSRVPLHKLFRMNRTVLRVTGTGLALLVPLVALNLGYHHAIERLFDLAPESSVHLFAKEGYGFPAVLATACVLPAIWEEIAFRGLIQERLRNTVGAREAWYLTALIFAIIHRAVLSWGILFLAGLLLGWLREKSRSLLPGMLVHFLYNLAVIVVES